MAFQERLQAQFQSGVTQFDKELSKYPYLVNLEKQTNVPKTYVIGGVGFLYFVLIFFNLGGQLLVNLAGFVIPAYYSLQVISPPFFLHIYGNIYIYMYLVCACVCVLSLHLEMPGKFRSTENFRTRENKIRLSMKYSNTNMELSSIRLYSPPSKPMTPNG
ncbi:ER membrane protein DP1/Yop1 [Orbilia oligospora]|nr:ER membrane protein DP1/Yop1 [Orbilia oligospora]KAF3249686.1 ER membrane protein DP1/Yop1 [Orbilia oligospora]